MVDAGAPARDIDDLSVDDVAAVARGARAVRVTPRAHDRVRAGRRRVEALAAGDAPVYGVTTGFGALAAVHVPPQQRAALQVSLVRSHAAGSGDPVPPRVVRAMMLLRLRTLCSGRTGVRPEVVDSLADLLSSGLVPVVPEHGSLGCSGDLAPLAHVALALIGEGQVIDPHGRLRPARTALAEHGLRPVVLAEKEGLALVNGTDGMLAMLCLAITDLRDLLVVADVVAAMSVEALLGSDRPFAADLVAMRPHPGQAASAANLRRLLRDSPLVAHRLGPEDPVQDAYSLRCAPQVAGAARDALTYADGVAERELRATIDNPVITADGRVESNGNFHGAPVAHALDFLAIPVADLASISERRIDRILDPARNRGLPPFLAHQVGVDSGYMIAHYTAAALVSQLKRWAVPASVDSIPTSAMQEDHASMGWAAGRTLGSAISGLRQVLAIELLVAGRALDLRRPLRAGPGTSAALETLRQRVAGPGPDRIVADEIRTATDVLSSPELLRSIQQVTGPLS